VLVVDPAGHVLPGAFFSTNLTLAPAQIMEVSVGLTEVTSWPSQVQITTPSFNLSLTYGRLFDLYDLKVEAYHDSTKSADGFVDIRTIV
jgi:hypothetical protein